MPQTDASKPQNKFSDRLEEALTHKEMTQSALAKKINVSTGLVSDWMNGKRLPSSENLIKICNLLGRSADWLLGRNIEIAAQLEASAGLIIEEHHGLKWAYMPPDAAEQQSNIRKGVDIQKGVELFNRIVRDNIKPQEVIYRYPTFAGIKPRELALLLRSAFFSRSIRLLEVKRDKGLENELEAKFGPQYNRKYVVAAIDLDSDDITDGYIRAEAIGFLAATEPDVLSSLRGMHAVGITGGTPLSRFVDLVPSDLQELAGISWHSLLGVASDQNQPIGLSANSLVARMVYKQSSARGRLMPYINSDRKRIAHFNKARNIERKDLENANTILTLAKALDVAFLTVGSPATKFDQRPESPQDVSEVRKMYDDLPLDDKARCAGDILLRLIDKNGHPLGGKKTQQEYEERISSISLEDLHDICSRGQVWILAERHEKASVVLAALRAKLANSLIIDRSIAKQILASPDYS